MAKIIQTQEQTDALKSVRNDLKQLKTINDFVYRLIEEESEFATLSASIGSLSAKFTLDKKMLTELLEKQQQKIKKEILSVSSRYCISLDPNDTEILNNC